MGTRIKMKAFSKKWMGKQVRFSSVFKRVYIDSRQVSWRATDIQAGERCIGWIVGIRWLRTGEVEPGFGRYEDYEPPIFHDTGKRILAYMIVPFPTMKPIPVPPESIEMLKDFVEPEFVDERTRRSLSKESIDWPRDHLGRFISLSGTG
jgi:hypothetical protein